MPLRRLRLQILSPRRNDERVNPLINYMIVKLIQTQEQAADRLKKQLEETSAAVAAREAELLANKTAMTEVTETDITIQGNTTGASALSGGSKQDSGIPKKKVLKPKMTAKERKERDVSFF